MVKEILRVIEEKMKKTVELFRKELAGVRAGRATPALLEKITVDYYGVATPVNQLANISVPEPRLLVIQPWDRSTVPLIEKAILKSDLGVTPVSDGAILRLTIPQLTRERRQELVKAIRKKGEEERVAIRNLRRDANLEVKEREKNKQLSEDESRRAQEEIQKLTDRYIKEIDAALQVKEKEIMEV